MRIASGGITHETNTFTIHPTTLDDFIRDSGGDPAFPPESIASRFSGSATIHGGYIDAAARRGVELVPTLQANATPGGKVRQSTYKHLVGVLLERLQAAMPADGVLLDLHGAMVTDQHEDAEGDLITAVRDLVGPSIPIVATLDLHANITALMDEQSDVLIGYDTYPHVDMGDRGVEALNLIADIAAGVVKPTSAYRQLPLDHPTPAMYASPAHAAAAGKAPRDRK